MAKLIHGFRIYFWEPEDGTWKTGRVLNSFARSYCIQFPNKEERILDMADFQVRWNRPITNPATLLACRINETPFFHSGRHPFMTSLTRQRGACAGMSGLFSSIIDLEKHQIDVVRRVLQDPIQRYLLADEVGLGKTVEAGVIIRQYVLDHPSTHCVLIILPSHLRNQWHEELSQKFLLEELIDKSIHLVSHSDTKRIRDFSRTAGMVVIDEAHHIAALASSPYKNEIEQFETTKTIAHNSERLLLLSATPVLHNEQSFLAMLHILDPAIYSLEGLDDFRARIQKRQEIAEIFHVLKEESPNFFIEGILDDLLTYFPKDSRLQKLIGDLRPRLDVDAPEDDPVRSKCIQAIRVHISELYRLHRRLLRNRRTGDLEVLVPGRAGLERINFEDPYLPWLEQALDEWRVAALSTVHGDENSERGKELAALAWLMIELATCDPLILRQAISVRLGVKVKLPSSNSLGMCILRKVPMFDEEKAILLGIQEGLQEYSDARLDALIRYLASVANKNSRHIVFATFPETADKIYEHLISNLDRSTVSRHCAGSSGWQKPEDRILVCDSNAEEGLNLQGGDTAMIHYDLPFSPNRIEQRIGRLDRFGVAHRVRSICLEAERTQLQTSWTDCLDKSISVFSRSIACLQYVIEDQISAVSMEFFTDGTDAIRSMTNTLGGDTGLLATELKKVRLQDEFDVIETDWEEDQEFYDRLWEVDCEQQEMATAANGWLIDRLNFISKPVNGYQDKVIRYKYRCPGNGPCTLVPVDELIKRFRPVIDINHSRFDPNNPCTFPLTYQRQTARSRGVRLARIGDSFIEAMHKHIRQDDRGVSFAMWRHIPNLKIEGKFWLAFRFDFVVEADLYPAQEFLEGQKTFHHDSLRRRMDALFPPFPRTLWLNEELQQITNPKALEMLSKPYSQKRNKDGYRDFNLNPVRWGNIESIIDHASWHSLCQASHDQAKVLLLNDQSTQEYIEVRLARAKHSIAVRLEQLQSRLDHQGERGRDVERHLVEQEKFLAPTMLRGIEAPCVLLDAAGAIFLSPEDPFDDMRK